jgi:hypothetical protein
MEGKMQFKRLGLLAFLLLGLLEMTLLGRNALAQDLRPPPIKLYVGTITGNDDEFVGITIFDGRATIYICDGQAEKGTVNKAEWFLGPVVDSIVDVIAPTGNSVHVELTDTAATGQFTFEDGVIKKFVLARGDGSAGLYRTEFTLADVTYVGGWLTTADGDVRGAVRNGSDGSLVPATFSGPIPPGQ